MKLLLSKQAPLSELAQYQADLQAGKFVTKIAIAISPTPKRASPNKRPRQVVIIFLIMTK